MLRMLGDKLLVRKEQVQKTKSEVLQVIERTEGKQTEGTVLAVGPGVHHPQTGDFIETKVSVGDRVLFGEGAGQEIEYEGEKYLVLHEPELYGIFPE